MSKLFKREKRIILNVAENENVLDVILATAETGINYMVKPVMYQDILAHFPNFDDRLMLSHHMVNNFSLSLISPLFVSMYGYGRNKNEAEIISGIKAEKKIVLDIQGLGFDAVKEVAQNATKTGVHGLICQSSHLQNLREFDLTKIVTGLNIGNIMNEQISDALESGADYLMLEIPTPTVEVINTIVDHIKTVEDKIYRDRGV